MVDLLGKPGNIFLGPACQNDQHQYICVCHEKTYLSIKYAVVIGYIYMFNGILNVAAFAEQLLLTLHFNFVEY
jgi:hypothetical protein